MGKVSYGSSEKAEFWMAAMELFRQSGLGCVDFCNREGLPYSTFCRLADYRLPPISCRQVYPASGRM